MKNTLTQLLQILQQFAKQDKTVITAVLVQMVVALVAGLGLHLNASANGWINALVAAGLGIFVHQNIKAKLAAAAK